MAEFLDMSLDDIIKTRKKKSREDFHGYVRPRGGGPGRGQQAYYSMSVRPGPTRRTPVYSPSSAAELYLPPRPPTHTVTDARMVEEEGARSGTKLYVSNLHYGVTNSDIKVLFSDVGKLKHHAIHYDPARRSKGTAEVIFERHSDALKAINRYNGMKLDNRPIKIEIIGGGFVPPAVPPPVEYTSGVLISEDFRSYRRDGSKQQVRREQEGHQGKKKRLEKVTAEALDADLEKYRQDALFS